MYKVYGVYGFPVSVSAATFWSRQFVLSLIIEDAVSGKSFIYSEYLPIFPKQYRSKI